MKKRKQDSAEVVSAIREGNVEKVKALLDSGRLLFRKGKITKLRNMIPRTFAYNGQQYTNYVDAFSFALSERQIEVAKFLIDSGVVDLGPGSQAPYMAIAAELPELVSYMLEKGLRIESNEPAISRLFLNLMKKWDDTWCAAVNSMDLFNFAFLSCLFMDSVPYCAWKAGKL